MERYFVVGLDDEGCSGCMVFMTHRWFCTLEDAKAYAVGVSPNRLPLVVKAIKEFYPLA